MQLRGFVLFAFLLGLLLSAPSFAADSAEDAPVIPVPLKVMPSKIKPVQTNTGTDELSRAAPENDKAVQADVKALEILSPRPQFGFQNDFWNGTNRQELAVFFGSPAIAHQSKAVRDLALKAALAPIARLPDSKNPDENMYALRLKKLVDLGSFDDAQKLYKMNEADPPTPSAALSGIEASLGNGEIAVACLDQKTFNPALKAKDPAFWTHVDTFCQALLGPVAGNDDALRLANASRAYIEIAKPEMANVMDINKLDVISTIAFSESGKLSAFLNSANSLKYIDDKHIGVLMNYAKPSYTALPLVAEVLTRGIVSNSKAIDFMKAIDLKDVSSPYNVFLKEYFKNPSSPAVSDALLDLTTDKTREVLLFPLYAAPEMAIPNNHKLLSLKLMAMTNQDLPRGLVMRSYGISENGTPAESSAQTVKSGEEILIKLLLEMSKSDAKTGLEKGNPTLIALYDANYPQNDMKNAYDNILSLTPSGNYVMPIGDILSNLKKSADKKQVHQVVIRSLALIHDKSLEQLHPAVLYQILEALNSAGLNEETMALTREVLASQIRN